MGRTKQFPCPSAVLLSVVPTKPYYTIVPVFVKGRCLLLDMFPAWHVGAGPARRHLLGFRRKPQIPLTSTSEPESIALERERNVRELTGCEAKQRSARSSILHIDGGTFVSPAVVYPPQNRKPTSCPTGGMSASWKSDCLWAFEKRAIDRRVDV
jgi:hypothetical protein